MDIVNLRGWLAICFLTCFGCTAGHAADESAVTMPTPPSSSAPVKLSPQIRAQPLSQAKYNVDTASMAAYLDNVVMFDSAEQYESQPYILGYASSGAMGGAGDLAYAAGIDPDEKLSSYTILKLGKSLVDPTDDEELGVMTHVIGAAEVKQFGDPQTIQITSSLEHIDVGSRLIPRTALDLPATLNAKTPAKAASGTVLYVSTATTGVGKLATVVVNLGDRDGLQQGDLLDCMEVSKTFSDKSGDDAIVKPTVFGEILIYKVMEKVSLGLILSSSRPVNVNDTVASVPKG